MSWISVLTQATWVATALVVLVLVFYLTGILVALVRAGSRLAAVAGALQQVAGHTDPLEARLGTINGALGRLHEGLRSIDQELVGIAGVFRL